MFAALPLSGAVSDGFCQADLSALDLSSELSHHAAGALLRDSGSADNEACHLRSPPRRTHFQLRTAPPSIRCYFPKRLSAEIPSRSSSELHSLAGDVVTGHSGAVGAGTSADLGVRAAFSTAKVKLQLQVSVHYAKIISVAQFVMFLS